MIRRTVTAALLVAAAAVADAGWLGTDDCTFSPGTINYKGEHKWERAACGTYEVDGTSDVELVAVFGTSGSALKVARRGSVKPAMTERNWGSTDLPAAAGPAIYTKGKYNKELAAAFPFCAEVHRYATRSGGYMCFKSKERRVKVLGPALDAIDKIAALGEHKVVPSSSRVHKHDLRLQYQSRMNDYLLMTSVRDLQPVTVIGELPRKIKVPDTGGVGAMLQAKCHDEVNDIFFVKRDHGEVFTPKVTACPHWGQVLAAPQGGQKKALQRLTASPAAKVSKKLRRKVGNAYPVLSVTPNRGEGGYLYVTMPRETAKFCKGGIEPLPDSVHYVVGSLGTFSPYLAANEKYLVVRYRIKEAFDTLFMPSSYDLSPQTRVGVAARALAAGLGSYAHCDLCTVGVSLEQASRVLTYEGYYSYDADGKTEEEKHQWKQYPPTGYSFRRTCALLKPLSKKVLLPVVPNKEAIVVKVEDAPNPMGEGVPLVVNEILNEPPTPGGPDEQVVEKPVEKEVEKKDN